MANTVLLIDRHAISRRMFHFALELQGHEIVTVDDLDAALAILGEERRIDLVIFGDGAIVRSAPADFDRLRSIAARNGTPLLLVDEAGPACNSFLQSSGCAWLRRPFRLEEIHGAVESLLGNTPSVRHAGAAVACGRDHA